MTKQQSPTGRRPVGDVTSDPRITMKSPAKPTTSHPSEIRHRNKIQNFFTTLKTKIRNRNCTRSRTEINFRGEPMNGRMSAADVGDAADRNKPLLRRVKNRGMSPADVGDAADRKKRSRRINHRVSPPDVGDATDRTKLSKRFNLLIDDHGPGSRRMSIADVGDVTYRH